jgi:hypothetical protein
MKGKCALCKCSRPPELGPANGIMPCEVSVFVFPKTPHSKCKLYAQNLAENFSTSRRKKILGLSKVLIKEFLS